MFGAGMSNSLTIEGHIKYYILNRGPQKEKKTNGNKDEAWFIL